MVVTESLRNPQNKARKLNAFHGRKKDPKRHLAFFCHFTFFRFYHEVFLINLSLSYLVYLLLFVAT